MKMITQTCMHCEQHFEARASEVKQGKYKYCSRPCAEAARTKKVHVPNVACARCEKAIWRTPSVLVKSKSGLFFCSRACKDSAVRERSVPEVVPAHYDTSKQMQRGGCLCCSGAVKPKRKFCSVECRINHNETAKVQAWLADPSSSGNGFGTVPHFIRRWLIEKHGDTSCWECGSNRVNVRTGNNVNQVDHIDGDSANNHPENLQRLCPTCHATTATYGIHGKGRPSRVVTPISEVKV